MGRAEGLCTVSSGGEKEGLKAILELGFTSKRENVRCVFCRSVDLGCSMQTASH